MNIITKINNWNNAYQPKWLWAFRLILGIGLFIKGFTFMQDHTLLIHMVSETTIFAKQTWLSNTIPWIHMFGGALLLLGFFTRLNCLVQLPVLIGAVIVNLRQSGQIDGTELLLAIVVLLLLVVFLIKGSGAYSLDNGLKQPNNIEALYS